MIKNSEKGPKRKELFERKVKLILYVGSHSNVRSKASEITSTLDYTPSQFYEDLPFLKNAKYLKEENGFLLLDERGREFISPFLALRRIGGLLWLVTGLTVIYALYGFLTGELPLVQGPWGQLSLLTQMATGAMFGALAVVLRSYPALLVRFSPSWSEPAEAQ